MVEAVVSVLFTKLISIIENDAIFHSDVKEEVRSLETELRWIKHAIRHAKAQRRPSSGLEMWLAALVNLSYDVEDVIDGYLLVGGIWPKIKARRRFVKKVGQIKTRAEKLSTVRSDYATEEPDVIREAEVAEYIADRRRTVHADEIVGLHTETARVEQWLENRGPERHVLSIIGMGGLGKTTLAGKVFKSGFVLRNFKTRVWVSVSQEYQLKAVFLNVLKQLTGDDSRFKEMNREELEKEISKRLQEEKYLVVLDDLWEKSAWDKISVAFPKNGKGSRFILTGRNNEVAPAAEHDIIMSLRLLNHEESWELFCRKMSFGGAVQSDLVDDLGRKIVKECCGLPLAIVVVAGLLRGRGLTQWPNVLKSITWWLFYSTNFTSKCRTILLLSYADLLDNLKSCFLFLGLFPEDFLISAKKLKLLWIAEGFVQPRGGATMEDVADDNLEELAQRNLIIVNAREYHGGPIDSIRVHDLLRDLTITEARKYGFLDIQPNNEYTSSSETSISEFRRFSLHSFLGQASLLHKKVRTILLFDGSRDIFKSILNGNKMIRVLDLEDVTMEYLPSVIGELVFLHYLGLRGTGISKVPDSLSKLERLQTLDISDTKCRRLPNKIWRLKNLRHLFLGQYYIEKLPRASAAVIESFGKNILTLELAGDAGFEDELHGPADFLVHFKSLKSLTINGPLKIGSSIKERSYVENLSNCFPSTLTELRLENHEFRELEMNVLANLPELKVLHLFNFEMEDDLIFPCGGFPQLQFLSLGNSYMKKWLVADDAIPNLVHLSIHFCRRLLELPDRLKTLNIQHIDFVGLSSMKDRHKENGEDWEKIKHIPIINYYQ